MNSWMPLGNLVGSGMITCVVGSRDTCQQSSRLKYSYLQARDGGAVRDSQPPTTTTREDAERDSCLDTCTNCGPVAPQRSAIIETDSN